MNWSNVFSIPPPFRDRFDGGRALAAKLEEYASGNTIVLALPRGGVPVGFEVASHLTAPLDVFVVRKLGVPGQEELAFGAIASGGVRVLSDRTIAMLGLTSRQIETATAREAAELARREREYRGSRPALNPQGKTVILVDDGLATGASMRAAIRALQSRILSAAHRLTGSDHDYDPLIERVGDARLVLLGEASHGTHEFYDARARITRRLIQEKGFHAVAAEADWPDAARVHAYVQQRGTDRTPDQALQSFERFPRWMWRNTDVRDFVGWLREHNDSHPDSHAGFYGLDLYSLQRSIEAVLHYLRQADPAAYERAKARYACFDHFGGDSEAYALDTSLGVSKTCEREVVEQLIEMQRKAREYASRDGWLAEQDFFSAEQNARVVKNAEEYYRGMLGGRISTWNLRDRHMAGTLEALLEHLDRRVGRSKVVVWEHNSHLGDARATDRVAYKEWNVGQLVRERYGTDCVLVGFTTYTGTVRAASEWDGPDMIKKVRPALPDSYELLLHNAGMPAFLLVFGQDAGLDEELAGPKLERAIGVIYRPETERISHYFHAELSRQFDAVIHFDTTRAVIALGGPEERAPYIEEHEAPETYPSGV